MRIPPFWARASFQESDANGEPVSFACWRSSEESESAARESALAAAKRVVRRLIQSERPEHYEYARLPMREEVLQELRNTAGAIHAVVTQNGYGTYVLNSARAMFVDIDFPAPGILDQLRHQFGRWLGRSTPSPEVAALVKTELFLQQHPDFGVRVYRTCAGMRLLVTHAEFDPTASDTLQLMRTLGADRLYVRLCQVQQCFRARLTPKPWRCGHVQNRILWPRDDQQQQRFAAWQAKYLECQAGYATCRYLGTRGSSVIHPAIAEIVELHDRQTRCSEQLELA